MVILTPIVPIAGDRISAVDVGSVFIDNISTCLDLKEKCNPTCPVLNKTDLFNTFLSFIHN
jgi:hypothetical protein